MMDLWRSPWLQAAALLSFFVCFSSAWLNERPVLEVHDGNLFVTSAKDKNITLKTTGTSSWVNVNGMNLLHIATSADNAAQLVERWKLGILRDIETTLNRLKETVEGSSGLVTRVAALEFGNVNVTTGRPGQFPVRPLPNPNRWNDAGLRNRVTRLTTRVRQAEVQIANLKRKLETDECTSNPCQNGGTCEDLIDGYKCRCSEGWEGPQCATDINECSRYAGTDLGCQNGANCRNLPGTFQCICQNGWVGIHCAEKGDNCNSLSSREVCGHGVCINKPGSGPGYTCICDAGWQTDGSIDHPACNTDVDECAKKQHPCSTNPMVQCMNYPGTFYCGPCPQGYTGNGYYCSDIDECATNNGGCSISPHVQCINTMGSRMCGSCPIGYQGDGVTCTYLGSCRIANGGCHPLATCISNPGMGDWYVQCRCPAGYTGNGMGPNGCVFQTDISTPSACSSNPCSHGTCVPSGSTDYSCRCQPGYMGKNCDTRSTPCDPNPCKNGGTCITSVRQVAMCRCTASYSGRRCEMHRSSCGQTIRDPVGVVQFPLAGNAYPHGLSCAWVLVTNESMVLNVTFSAFNLELSTDCQYDFLQVHDGPTAGEHMIGRYCGNSLPQGGNIISSVHSLYLWFHSDNSINKDGFTFEWNSIPPLCGGEINEDEGTITSPGSPGRYPKDRDCTWHVNVTPGKRIKFFFSSMMLEDSPACSKDYLEIRNGPTNSSQQLGLYCNHTRPSQLVTPENEAWLHFHSDGSGQDNGFHITFTTEAHPGCGGVFTASSGTITSPDYHTDGYGSRLDCDWKIQAPQGERIQITWTDFEVESSHSCIFDYVQVFDGGSREAPLLGEYCGTTLPPNILSQSNVLLIRFRSDWSYNGRGFRLNYEIFCGGEFTEETGVLKSPYYPNPYPASRICIYKIMQPLGKAIRLTIQDMEIEGWDGSDCYFDRLEIHDGQNENYTTIGTYCGSNASIPEFPIMSTYNYLWIKFETDNSIHNRGFMASYTTVDRGCGGILHDRSGIIQSPSEDGKYSNEEDCTWIIQAPPGFVIQLNWLSFDIEQHYRCRFDYVKISENITQDLQQDMGTYCGSTKPPLMTTQSQLMSIYFHTDSSWTRDGFMASYIFVDASKVCGGHFSTVTGVIKSPNYPDRYPTHRDCEWIITAPNRHQVTLNVKKFDLERAYSVCTYDTLEIRNGGTTTSPLMGKYCGTEIPPTIKSFGNQMYLKFKSDGSRSGEGFMIEWDSSTVGCGGTLTSTSGSISSPNYPQPYHDRAECTWHIRVAAGSKIQFVIVDLELEEHSRCHFDYIEIFDGPVARGQSRGRYCGADHPLVVNSTSNIASVRFRSDWTGSGRGFLINYQALCQNKVTGFRGVIESPNFPEKYPHRANCSWIVEAPIGNKLNLTFSHFDLEGGSDSCRYDYLDIKEGNHDVATRDINKYCDSMALPPKIVSTERQVFLNFHSDSYTASTGFRVEWAVNGCGGLLAKPEGTITSPGYPHSYPAEIVCEWNIEVDYLHSINITLEDVDLEKTAECHFDKLTIYLGNDDTAPKLIETCHVSGQRVITSTSNKIFIRFKADASFQGRGFKLTYKTVDITCGGRFTTATGLIHSANYPRNYPGHQYCEWLIQVSPNYLVNLTFTDFALENTRNCSDDYVKIYDGPTTENSAVLGFHCGNEPPPSYVSTTNELLVIMRSDEFIGAKGFEATYDLACGARIITNDQGILQMDPAVGLHTNIVNCTWTIVAANPEDHVTLAFTDMQLKMMVSDESDCSESSITVFEGDGIDGPSLGNWCGNKVPPPIVSTGNALTVHATSMYRSLYDAKFAASYSVLNSACGGNYTAEHGRIASPGYPNNYPQNVECVWYLRTSPGNSISVTFAEFELVQSESCNIDYVEVREEDGAGKLIGVFCGQSTNQITSRKSLWMKFKSSGDETKKGFVADYSLIHGNELDGPSGDIASPLYPQPCRLDGEYYWRVVVEVGSAIQITFKDFHIERYNSDECYMSLTIYDGYNDEAPELISACGNLLPGTKYSTSNVVYIKFYMYPLTEGSWFLLSWLQVPRDSGKSGVDSDANSGCDQTIALTDSTKDNHTFNSPGWPTGYENNLNCDWIFESIPGTHLVMKFDSLNLEESYKCILDHVRVFTGHSPNSRREWSQIGSYCLPNATSEYIIVPTNLMKVTFHSDVSFSKTGFNATVRRVCGGQLSGPNGIIEFNSSTSTHRSSHWVPTQCEWNITVRSGRTIEVTFIALNIPSTTPNACGDHYLMLKNGGSEDSPLLGTGKYCGRDDPAPLQTTGNQLHVKVFGQQMATRFKIRYREVGTTCGNQIILTDSMKSWNVSTPNFPYIPPPHSECIWTIMAPAGEQISIHFGSFYLATAAGCSKEYLEIRDGATETSALMGRFCKAEIPNSMSTTGNTMYLHFFTDLTDPNNGFNATVVIGDTCGGVIRGTRGIVKSPNYPAAYPSNVTCKWYIVGPPGHTLKLQIRDIDFPPRVHCENGDYVGIAERVLRNSTEYSHSSMNDFSNFEVEDIGKYCGRETPPVVETSGNTAVVTFRSTVRGDIRNRGFRLNFTSSLEKCGGPLTASTGEFSTPGYPTLMPRHHRYCLWRIEAPEGYRIQLDIIGFDLGDVTASRSGSMTPRMAFYNDFGYESFIEDIRPTSTKRQILSTSNKMTVYYWSGSGSHRGIKARYTQVLPALCGSRTTNDRGTLMSEDNSIFNYTSFSCNWKVQSPTMNTTTQTLALTVSGVIGSASSALKYPCRYSVANVIVYGEASHMISCVSGNLTKPVIVRSPLPVHMITASKGRWQSPVVNLGLSYRWHQCGGILGGPSHTISTPVSTSYPIDCAWHAKFPDSGETVELTFKRKDLKCDRDYIIIRNGGPLAPQIGNYCGSIIPPGEIIVSQSNELWIEFHGEDSNATFELQLETRQDGCGGLIQGRRSADISSPGFPGNYPNNAECMWEIEVENGYHIGLIFLDRFNLESSTNCSNDFIQVFDWREDMTTGLSSWLALGKACGRNTPSPFNSTSHRMKILFRSNNAIQGDGFRARWNENCGGVIPVYKKTQYLTSPGFPLRYRGGLSCNYTFVAPGKNFILEFTDFQLEDGSTSGCQFDNVSVTSNKWETDPPMWCGESGPPPQRVSSRSEVIFKTDPYLNRQGFRIKYHLDECGGEINTPSEIKSPSIDANGHYYSRINCTWVVRAPPGKSVIVKFESFHLEYSIRCHFDYLALYSGVTINTTNRLALLCGSLNSTLNDIKSENGSMTINFVTDQSFNFGGFLANIEFTTRCGGQIHLSSSQTFRTQRGSTYDSLEDCHWLVKAPSSNVVKLTMTSLDLKNSTSALRNGECAGDYIEVRDGGGPLAELIGKYCGNVVPSPITSSSNVLWIRFVSDATLNGNGVVATLENIPSVCGESILTVGNTTQILTSPNYPSNYGPGLRCKWSLADADPRKRDRFTIHFVQFDLENSEKCAMDGLSISDRNTRNSISEGLGKDLIFSGTPERPRTMWMGSHIPHETYSYCGNAVPHDYYSMGNQVEIQFKSSEQSSGRHVGFKLEYGMSTCNRNFTGEQGRIYHHDVKDCWFTITAPVGHTISLYFNEFVSFDHSGCTNSALQIFDGNFNNNTLATLCGYTVPNPVFSTGNKLSFHSWSRGSYMYKGYDMTYMTTDKGRGCGGKLYNYGGQFTSPLYPGSYRNESECIWEVSVPTGFNIKLEFKVFDLGRRACESDYIQFVDVQSNGDNSSPTQFCGEDEPAVYHSTTGQVLVKYHTSVNNGGTGWVIDFTAEHNNRS